MRLARIPNASGPGRAYQNVFGGLNENVSARDGEIAAMENMSSDRWPLLSPRPRRYRVRTLEGPNGLAAKDALCWVDGTAFYYDGVKRGDVSDGEKRFCFLNRWVVIWPDKLCYNTETGQFGPLEAALSVDGEVRRAIFTSAPAPGGISSQSNCLVLDSTTVQGVFRAGDAVTISGCGKHPENDLTLVVREVLGSALYFYDNSFTLDLVACYTAGAEGLPAGAYNFEYRGRYYNFLLDAAMTAGDTLTYTGGDTLVLRRGGADTEREVEIGAYGDTWLTFELTERTYAEAVPVTVSRRVPDVEFLCECDNRLWGVMGQTVCCSALGDPRVWYNFDGTATSAWSVEVGSGGAFTGMCAYAGYPLLFKEDHIYRVYGTKPQNFQLMDTETLGCEAGSDRSFAVVGQTLYYKSRAGFAAYAGGVPRLIDGPLGTARRHTAVAGSDGRKYYVSVSDDAGRSLYVYDTVTGVWHREDATDALAFAWCGGELYMLVSDGGLWQIGRVRTPLGTPEEEIRSMAEFADFVDATFERRSVVHLYLRVQAEGELRLLVSYDGGDWQEAGRVDGRERGVRTLHLIPRRCDRFRVRLVGRGDWMLWAMGREYAVGSTGG